MFSMGKERLAEPAAPAAVVLRSEAPAAAPRAEAAGALVPFFPTVLPFLREAATPASESSSSLLGSGTASSEAANEAREGSAGRDSLPLEVTASRRLARKFFACAILSARPPMVGWDGLNVLTADFSLRAEAPVEAKLNTGAGEGSSISIGTCCLAFALGLKGSDTAEAWTLQNVSHCVLPSGSTITRFVQPCGFFRVHQGCAAVTHRP
jgi:hypothetical protein